MKAIVLNAKAVLSVRICYSGVLKRTERTNLLHITPFRM